MAKYSQLTIAVWASEYVKVGKVQCKAASCFCAFTNVYATQS